MRYLHFLFFCAILCACESYKILGIFPMPYRSHYELSSKLLNELANRGHDVTVVTPFFQKTPVKNLREISVEPVIAAINVFKRSLFSLGPQSVLANTKFVTDLGYVLTENVLGNENVQKLLQANEKYDIVLISDFVNDGLMGIAHHFNAPLVLLATMPQLSWNHFLMAHPSPPSYVPNLLSTFTGRMDFWQRLKNTFFDVSTLLYHQWIVLPKHRELVKRFIPGAPDLYDFLNNASFLLINSHVSTYEALPQLPNAIEIGGFHILEPKKLPDDLQKFMDESVHGVVVFSMGSNLNSSNFPETTRKAILNTFSKIKQDVLWKWETEEMPGRPKNVKLMKWLPQADCLAHPNVKAFIGHGGLLSTMESIYHGLPILGLPVFCDQKMNMALATAYEYGIEIPFGELTEETFSAGLDQILNNPKYKNNVKKRSKIMQDRPIKPMDSAIYWIEYVIRHEGAPHLRYPGVDLRWYQRNLLDVIAFVLVITICSIYVIFVVFKRILKRNCRPQDKDKKIK